MKHTITDWNNPNEPVMFSNSILGKFCFDMFFGELEDELSPVTDSNNQSKLHHSIQIAKHNCSIVDSSICIEIDSSDCTSVVSSSTNFYA